MILTVTIMGDSQERIKNHRRLAMRAPGVLDGGLETAAQAGAEDIRAQLQTGQLGLTMRRPGGGLASSVFGWMISPGLAAVGVPSSSPAAEYAGILERGGTIVPKPAGALAVPISAEAKAISALGLGPRDMADLTLIPRQGRPPLLVRKLGGGDAFELHWVLVQSVTIPAFRWLTDGASNALPTMSTAMQSVLDSYAQEWNRG